MLTAPPWELVETTLETEFGPAPVLVQAATMLVRRIFMLTVGARFELMPEAGAVGDGFTVTTPLPVRSPD